MRPAVVGDIMLFGKTPEEAAASMMPAILGDGFGQSIAMVGHALGFALDAELRDRATRWRWPPRPSTRPIGPIQPGRIAAQKFCWEATVRGAPVITVRTNWFMGQDHLDPAWTFGPEGERFEVEVTGDPSSRVTFHGWHPESIAAGLIRNPGGGGHRHPLRQRRSRRWWRPSPGIKSYLDLPPYTGRAARPPPLSQEGPCP